MKTRNKYAFILNLITFILCAFAILWMMSGIQPYGNYSALSAARLASLKYFTVDSNILMGIAALIACIWDKKAGSAPLPASYYVLKLVSTAGVTLTMLVTVFFLAPTARYGWISLFMNSNFLLHLINPLLAIVTFICFERTDRISLKMTPLGIIPMALYAVYYLGNAMAHTLENGQVPPEHDWYGFLAFGGIKTFPIVITIVTLVMYLISLGLWAANRKRR